MRNVEKLFVTRLLRQFHCATSSNGWQGATSSKQFSTIGLESGAYTAKNLRGMTMLVTGSTDGIGFHTASLLAQHGATVLVHGRSLLKVKKTIKFLRIHSGNRNVYGYCEDLSSLTSTRRLAASVAGDLHKFFQGRLDCLINNAGVFMEDKEVTEDGLEMTWAVNTAAPFLLTSEILPFISDHGRIVNCSSISLADFIDLNNTQQESGYERGGHAAYGVSKLALNMWSYRLASLLRSAGKNISVNCVDPGTVSTKLLFAGWGEVSYVALSVEEADDVFWGATAQELENVTGKYFVNRKSRQSSGVSYELDRQLELWKLLERQTGASFQIENAPA